MESQHQALPNQDRYGEIYSHEIIIHNPRDAEGTDDLIEEKFSQCVPGTDDQIVPSLHCKPL